MKQEQINYCLFLIILFAAIFEAHITKALDMTSLPLVETILILLFLLVFVNYFVSSTIKKIELYIFLFAALLLLTGVFKQNVMQVVLGVFFISKPFLAFICGLHIPISQKNFQKILIIIARLSLLSIFVSALQFIGIQINPFDFKLVSSGIIGILDNPNKNAQLMLYGYLVFSNVSTSYLKQFLIPLYVLGILFTGSRQGLIFFLLILFFQEIIIKKRWKLVVTTIPFIIAFLIYFSEQFLYRFTNLIERINSGEYFRLKALKLSLEILKDNFFFGQGAGSFGGIVAYWYDSPLQRDLWKHWENYIYFPKTIDIYLPHLWAEIGIVGIMYFVFLLVLIIRPYYLNRKKERKSTAMLFLLAALFLFSITSMSLEASFFTIVIFLLLGANFKFNMNRPSLLHG